MTDTPSTAGLRRDVVVVGAGLAGLAAARALRDRDVVVLEAAARAGGRLRSLPRGPYWLNLGAGVFSATPSPVRTLIDEVGLTTREIPGCTTGLAFGDRILTSGRIETYPLRLPLSPRARLSLARAGLRIRLAVRRYHQLARPRPDDTPGAAEARVAAFEAHRSFAEFLGRVHPDVDAIMRATAANRIGAELETLSANAALGSFAYQWSGEASILNHNLVGGSGRLPEALARDLGARVVTSAEVVEVAPDEDGVVVGYRAGGREHVVHAGAAIVATPADVSRRLIRGLPASVDTALGEVRYGPAVLAAMLTAEEGSMPYDDTYAVITPGRATTVFINVASTLRTGPRLPGGSVLLYSGGEGARPLLAETDAELERRFVDAFHELYPPGRGLVREVVVQRWERIVPFAQPGRHRLQAALETPLGRIFLAGDYLGSWANMEVAVATGLQASEKARAVLAERSPTV